MSSNRKMVAGLTAGIGLILSGFGCSDSGNKRAVADSSSQYRNESTATVVPTEPAHSTVQDNSYSDRTAYDADAPRKIVRVSATDPAIRGTSATATYDAKPRTNSNVVSKRNGSTLVVAEEPPLMPPEIAPTPKGDEFWVNGYWKVKHDRFVWEPGHMDKLRSNELYHPAKWTQTEQGWEFTPAYWD